MSELQRLQVARLADLPASVRVTIRFEAPDMNIVGFHAGGWSGYAASMASAFTAIDKACDKWNDARYAAVYADSILRAAGL